MVEFLHVKDEKKKIEPIFKEKIVKVSVGSIQYGVTETFCDRNCVWIFLSDFLGKMFQNIQINLV